jgi:predicted pyridoxine 5'-phosphate oxidase superfamily flavin-nucleotide-binding protein
MHELKDELNEAISRIKPAMLATADKDGRPSVSPKGSLRVLDEKHLIFADLLSPQTLKNLKENPSIAMIGLDPATRKGGRIGGKVDEIATAGDLYDQISKEYADKGKVNHIAKVFIEKSSLF